MAKKKKANDVLRHRNDEKKKKRPSCNCTDCINF